MMRVSVDVTVLGRLAGALGAVDPVALIARQEHFDVIAVENEIVDEWSERVDIRWRRR